jgi:hypothetical protein
MLYCKTEMICGDSVEVIAMKIITTCKTGKKNTEHQQEVAETSEGNPQCLGFSQSDGCLGEAIAPFHFLNMSRRSLNLNKYAQHSCYQEYD